MKCIRLWSLGLTLTLLCVSAARGQTPAVPLTLQQAIDIARAKNPSLLSGQQHLVATKANEITAGLRQNPSFTLSGTDVSLPASNPASPYSYSANVTRLFE